MVYVHEVKPIGLDEGWPFYLIHAVGLFSLFISLVCCVAVLYLIFVRHSKIRSVRAMFARPIGERLVIYLATCNLLYSCAHVMDHSYMLETRDNPPDRACAAFAFFLNEFVVAQSLIVTFTALNAFVMVVKETKIPLGKYDWGLFAVSLGLPFVIGVLGVSTQHFGPSGLWCYMDHRTEIGSILTNVVGIVMLVTFTFNIACYSAVWIKIKQTAKKLAKGESDSKYTRSARTMMLFVAVYIFQWWSYVAYACWLLAEPPHLVIMVCAVFFSNMGGLFNLITYWLMRRQKRTKVTDTAQAPTNNQAEKTKTTTVKDDAQLIAQDVPPEESTSIS